MIALTPPLDRMRRRVARYLHGSDAGTSNQVITFAGDYQTWTEAQRASDGYDTPVILERTFASLQRVKRGDAVFERDSVLFDTPQYSFPVLTALLRAALEGRSRLSVADVGGSLGSSYFQCRSLLQAVDIVEWSVIEQAAYVRCGREHFEDRELRFYETIDECRAERQPGVLLLSGVLQYLPDPYSALEQLLSHRLPHVIVDRTAFLASGRDRLTVQTVPDNIYPASYPAWFLSEGRVVGCLRAAGYGVVYGFPALDTLSPIDEAAYYKGLVCEYQPGTAASADESGR